MPLIAYASVHTVAAQSLVGKLNDVVLFPLMTLLTSIALVFFLWGVFQYIYNSSDPGARDVGRLHMLWGIIGLLIMLSAYAILKIALATFGVPLPT